MKDYNMKVVAVILEGSTPTAKESRIANALGARSIKFVNGKFAVAKRNERVLCTALVNLSGKEELDEFYKDVLIDVEDYFESLRTEMDFLAVKEVEVKEVEKVEVPEEPKEEVVEKELPKQIKKEVKKPVKKVSKTKKK